MSRLNRIKQKLDVLKPHYLDVIDQSNAHAGHYEGDSDESHFKIQISASELHGKKLLDQHKIIKELLKEEFDTGLHALSIEIIKSQSYE